MNRDRIDLTELRTAADIDAVKWEDYASSLCPFYVKYIKEFYTTTLDRVCELSLQCDTVRLSWSAGELYFTRTWQRELPFI